MTFRVGHPNPSFKGMKRSPEAIANIRAGKARNAKPEAQRFNEKVDRSAGPDACHLWTASCGKDGYGRFIFRGVVLNAHRVAMILHLGSVPSDRDVDHFRCKERRCVNVAHLRLATEEQNALENNESPFARNKRKTHCKYGHPLSGDNIRVHVSKSSRGSKTVNRLCLACYGPGGARRTKGKK